MSLLFLTIILTAVCFSFCSLFAANNLVTVYPPNYRYVHYFIAFTFTRWQLCTARRTAWTVVNCEQFQTVTENSFVCWVL